jgi:putative ABC transport system permease protein
LIPASEAGFIYGTFLDKQRPTINQTMLKNYLVTAVRNLLRERGTTLINLSGLTIGITCSIILFLLISFHRSFDNFHEKKDRIVRIVNSSEGNQGREFQSGIPPVLPDAFRLDLKKSYLPHTALMRSS